jgi:hypothetical protein
MPEDTDLQEASRDEMYSEWLEQTHKLRDVANAARWLAARLAGRRSDPGGDMPWIVEDFRKLTAAAERGPFEHLILLAGQLHNRGVEVLHPERGAYSLPSPFVRCMSDSQEEIEARRDQLQWRHMASYEDHIVQCIEHFVAVWTSLIDGALICDWAMIDDEFPKIAILDDEVRRAFDIWTSLVNSA